MEQTALNLVAIGIFGMTLSALLGPIFGISPAIPALTTLGILSLATLDGVRFQGKGINVLLDAVAGLSGQHRDRVLHHEAGHFLAAYFLGIPITGYTLTAWEALQQGQPGSGGVTFDTGKLSPNIAVAGELRLNLERFCTVWMAGIAAETLIYGAAEGGTEDRGKLRAALVALGRPAREAPLKERWAMRQAQTLLREHQAAYEALVAAMKRRASVEECCLVIQNHSQSLEQPSLAS